MNATGGRIVVGIDESQDARVALEWAVHQASRTGATVTATIAWRQRMQTSPIGARTRESFRERAETLVRAAGEAVPGDVEVVAKVEEGHPGEVLVAQARTADLLVLGHHAGSAAAIGGVVQYCLRHSPCPVVLVPNRK